MPEKKKKIIAFSDTLHILFEMNLEIEEPERRKIRVSRENNSLGERRGGGGGGEGVNELCQKKYSNIHH